MFTLAHLTDPHIAPLPEAGIGDLLSKRILGFISWTTNRRRIHDRRTLERISEDLVGQRPDHTVVTGDIVNISLTAEFDQSVGWLEQLGSGEVVTVIPGNHDAYVPLEWEDTWSKWADYMCGAREPGGDPRPARSFDDFPFVRRVGPVAIVGVSSACPMPPFSAAGRLGKAQARRLELLLSDLAKEDLFRVVLVHHPPLSGGASRRKRLLDNALLVEAVQEHGADLILHGHTHWGTNYLLPGPGRSVPVMSANSASACQAIGKKGLASYHLYRIERAGGEWRVEVEVRGFEPDSDDVVSISRFDLAPAV